MTLPPVLWLIIALGEGSGFGNTNPVARKRRLDGAEEAEETERTIVVHSRPTLPDVWTPADYKAKVIALFGLVRRGLCAMRRVVYE